MPLQPARIYKDIFGADPPASWTEGSPSERQRSIDEFMAQSEQMEISDADFDRFTERIRRNREITPRWEMNDEVDAA